MYSIVHKTRKTIERIWYLGHTAFDFFRTFVSPGLTNIIFSQDDSIFFVYCLKHFGNSYEVYGPEFDQIFEVPRIIQKVLVYDRGP